MTLVVKIGEPGWIFNLLSMKKNAATQNLYFLLFAAAQHAAVSGQTSWLENGPEGRATGARGDVRGLFSVSLVPSTPALVGRQHSARARCRLGRQTGMIAARPGA